MIRLFYIGCILRRTEGALARLSRLEAQVYHISLRIPTSMGMDRRGNETLALALYILP